MDPLHKHEYCPLKGQNPLHQSVALAEPQDALLPLDYGKASLRAGERITEAVCLPFGLVTIKRAVHTLDLLLNLAQP